MTLTHEQLSWLIQFDHPEKALAGYRGELDDAAYGALFGVSAALYRELRAALAANARRAAQDLLADPAFAARVDRLPFKPGAVVVGVGDSMTDDDQSWFEILCAVFELRRPRQDVAFINAGFSGDTTVDALSRFYGVTLQHPDWIICFIGTNDARRHGRFPLKPLLSAEETARNLAALRHFGATQTSARWVWITPPPCIPEKIAAHWHLSQGQLSWVNEDLIVIGDAVRRQSDPVIDLQALFGAPARSDWLLDDGLHPSLAGHVAIVSALVSRLSGLSD